MTALSHAEQCIRVAGGWRRLAGRRRALAVTASFQNAAALAATDMSELQINRMVFLTNGLPRNATTISTLHRSHCCVASCVSAEPTDRKKTAEAG